MERRTKVLEYFQFKRIVIPILIGLGVAAFLLYNNLTEERYQLSDSADANYIWVDTNNDMVQDIDEFINVERGTGLYKKMTYRDVLAEVSWQKYSVVWIFMSILLMLIRDFAYMLRLRILTEKTLSWKQCFQSIMLWEFASAVTPSVVGGSAVAIFILNKEGLSTGKSTAIVMVTAFLDELFYIIMVPLVFLIAGISEVFPKNSDYIIFNSYIGIEGFFIIGYSFILILTTFIIYAIFINPKGFKKLLLYIFRLPFLRRWQRGAEKTGDDLIETSREMKKKPLLFWFKAFGATFLSWTARFWVVNCLIMVFITVNSHFLIYARQLIMWVIILIAPTPGSSGIAELVFSDFLRDFISIGFSPAIALLWRLISYYPYLFIGFIILPHWLKRVMKKKETLPAN